jgi:O-antigen/teichoic acid export membrane protein
MADNLEVMRQGFLNVLSIIALFAIPASFGIASIAKILVDVMLGNKWHEAVPLIQIFSISGLLIALQSNASVIYNAIGKPRYMTFISLFQTVILFIPLLFFLLKIHGVIGIAEAYLITSIIIWPINYSVIVRLIDIRWYKILLELWRPCFAGVAMFFCIKESVFLLKNCDIENDVFKLAILIFGGAFVYVIAVIILWVASGFPEGAEKFIFKKLKRHKRLESI